MQTIKFFADGLYLETVRWGPVSSMQSNIFDERPSWLRLEPIPQRDTPEETAGAIVDLLRMRFRMRSIKVKNITYTIS